MAKKKVAKPKETEPVKTPRNLVSLLPGQSIELGGVLIRVESIGSFAGGDLPPGQRLPMVRLDVTAEELPVLCCGELPELSMVPLE